MNGVGLQAKAVGGVQLRRSGFHHSATNPQTTPLPYFREARAQGQCQMLRIGSLLLGVKSSNIIGIDARALEAVNHEISGLHLG
jgi:hypothetical protein